MKKWLVVLGLVLSLVVIGKSYAVDETADYIVRQTGSGQVYIGSQYGVLAISVYGATAGDYIGVYDYGDSSHKSGPDVSDKYDIRDLEFELGITANSSSNSIQTHGWKPSFGLNILSSAATNQITVLYDY